MESSGSRSEMGVGGGVMLTKPTPSRPTLTLPPRNPAEAFLRSSDAASPSPMTFVSGLFVEQDPYADCKSFSQLLAGAMASPSPRLGEGLNELVAPTDSPLSNHISGMPAGGSFADSLAARGAGNKVLGRPGSPGTAPSNAARLKLMTPSRIPIPSPYFTIPSGLSPTMLLDSPVLFSTGQAEPSPTTGSFPFASPVEEGTSALAPGAGGSKKRSSKQDGDFVFKPYPTLARNPLPLSSMGPFGVSHQQALAQVQAQAQSQGSSGSSGAGTPPVSESTSVFTSAPSFSGSKLVTPTQSQGPVESTAEPQTKPSEKAPSLQVSVPPLPPSHAIERPSEDGYNWRKYGQKQVKGSEYPRSYYKCTNPSCPVKKKVERSLDGQVTEIVYKGEHSHPKPQATRRAMSGAHISDGGREASHSMPLEGAETMNGIGKADNDSAHPSSSLRGQLAPYNGRLSRTPEPSSGSTSDDDGEDDEASKAEGGGEDEPDSKHRRIENETLTSAPLRTIREPRVVVQTTSDVDILDDGYRWRKYGQKVVKGNPHPRSYYKCTNVGCSVRKHVERSSTDIKAVITTYEGKHNHDVPAARNSNHNTNGTAAASVPPPSLSGITSYWN